MLGGCVACVRGVLLIYESRLHITDEQTIILDYYNADALSNVLLHFNNTVLSITSITKYGLGGKIQTIFNVEK